MTEWINNKFELDLSENDLVNVKNFSLIWNVYDNLVCQSEFSIARIEQEYSGKTFNADEIQPFFEYFKNRYIDNGSTNERFNYLRFRRNDREQFVRDVLLENITNTNSKVLAISIIIYRYRNNLFHGLKDFRFIDQQDVNFENANRFLMTIMNYF